MVYVCDSKDINKIKVEGKNILTLDDDWYIEATAFPAEKPIDWLDIKIRKKDRKGEE